MQKKFTSELVFILLILVSAVGKLTWTACNFNHPIVQQFPSSWEGIVLAALLGFLAIKLAKPSGIPDICDSEVPNSQRFLVPAVIGIIFGVIQIIIISSLKINVPMVSFPLSIPVYFSAGIILEIFYRLVPIVFLVWFISSFLLKGKAQNQVFWAIAVLLALLEPMQQISIMIQMEVLTEAYLGVVLFFFVFTGNILPAYFLRKSGFLAAVIFRLCSYLIWHIIWGGFFLV